MLFKKELTEYNRYQAFAIHMAISLIIFFIILVCITQYWYPGILFDTGNGWKAIGMIVGIDLILGPLLTLVVFNHNKSSLKFDLSIIALVQTTALVYGTWTIYSSHPIGIAYIHNSFITFYSNAKDAEKIKAKIEQLNTNQLFYIFDDNYSQQNLDPSQLTAYKDYANSIPSIVSSYYVKSNKKNELLIQIDPLATSNRYIIINENNGSILRFTKSSPSKNKSDE